MLKNYLEKMQNMTINVFWIIRMDSPQADN